MNHSNHINKYTVTIWHMLHLWSYLIEFLFTFLPVETYLVNYIFRKVNLKHFLHSFVHQVIFTIDYYCRHLQIMNFHYWYGNLEIKSFFVNIVSSLYHLYVILYILYILSGYCNFIFILIIYFWIFHITIMLL